MTLTDPSILSDFILTWSLIIYKSQYIKVLLDLLLCFLQGLNRVFFTIPKKVYTFDDTKIFDKAINNYILFLA